MNVIFVLIPLGLLLLAAAIWAFFWAVRSGQFDDLEAQGAMVLFDDAPFVVAKPPRGFAATAPSGSHTPAVSEAKAAAPGAAR
ncbi:MAG: cbb3-type cytochrome oxidase assembly protein CcoS [Candidatus Binatia bacterium]